MKIKATLIILSLCMSSFAVGIPEAEELHPEKYTIKFALAELPSDFDINSLSSKDIYKNYSQLSDKEKMEIIAEQKKAVIKQIKESDSIISTLAIVHSAAGKNFSDEHDIVRGKLDSDSNTIDIFQLTVPNYGTLTLDPLTIDMKSNDWFTLFLGGKIIDGKQKNYCVLIKCYSPKK